MPIPWDEDPPGYEQRIRDNILAVLSEIAGEAQERHAPTVEMAREWHRRIYDGVPLPVSYYAGEVRDADRDFPELNDYEVAVGPFPGTPAAQVLEQLARFERSALRAVGPLDAAIASDGSPAAARELHGVLVLCALLHGEWVRIHPFANGNGRTARLWANWAALRYRLPPFVTVRPRPGQPYGVAAVASMQGNHAPAVAAFGQMLRQHLRG